MEKIVLKAQTRTATGKTVAKDLRNKGMVPANVYKSGKPATSLVVSGEELISVLHTNAGENVIITLNISGSGDQKDKTVVIKEIQREPIKFEMLHVDFEEISLTEVLKVDVPISTHGEPAGVKIDGGTLEHVIRELHIECLPTAIPEKIEVEVSDMKIGDAIYIKDLKIPDGVRVLNDPELIVLIVKAPKVEVPVEEAEEAASEGPELIRKKKEEDDEEGKEAKPATGEKPHAPEPKKEEKK